MSEEFEKKLNDLFTTIDNSSEPIPTHFKLLRAVKSPLIKLIPSDTSENWVSDYHLDSYAMHFYHHNKEMSLKIWWGTNTFGIETDKILPFNKLETLYIFS